MSRKTAKAAIAKNRKNKRLSYVQRITSDIQLKELEAQNRLGSAFCVFIKVKDKMAFFVVADNNPEMKNHKSFVSITIGASNSELGEARDVLNELESSVAELYSPADFHPTVALYFLSRYLKGTIQEFWLSKTLAVELMIFDPMTKVLHAIRLNGDYESYNVGHTEKTFIIIGAYNNKLRKEICAEMQKCIDHEDISEEAMHAIGDKFYKKYGPKFCLLAGLSLDYTPQPADTTIRGSYSSR